MNPRHIAIFNTRDLKLATILDWMGFEFESDKAPATRIKRESGDESTVFHYKASHPTSGQQADEVMRVFAKTKQAIENIAAAPLADQKNLSAALWPKLRADHPGSHAVIDATGLLFTRDGLLNIIKATPRQIVFERNGKIVSISENATEADKKRFAKFL
jgi:hypothetical protein